MENNIPPVGMCGRMPAIAEIPKVILAHTHYSGEQILRGTLGGYKSPRIEIRFMKGNETTEWVPSLIDTGSYYSLAKPDLLKKAGADFLFTSRASSPRLGLIEENIYSTAFQIAGLPIGFSTLFMGMNMDFMYDVILGSHIFDIADLYVFGKENRFELIFK